MDEPDVGGQMGEAVGGPEGDKKPTGTGCLVVGLFVCLLVVAITVANMIQGSDDGGGGGDSGTSAGAFGVCTQFVEDRLRAPGTASFPNQFQDDGEVTITGGPDVFTVSSHVDAENGFGGEVRTPFVCEVRHVEGENWRLVDLSLG